MSDIKGYTIRDTLYESNNSLIFRAHRIADNLPVILKVLREEYPSLERIAQFKEEFEIARSLNSESGGEDAVNGVIATYRLVKHQHSFVIVMEDFGGISLDLWMNRENKYLLANSPSEFLPLAIQVTESLARIHERQIIHKDINPSNIILNIDTGHIKIIDFGISTSLLRENPIATNPHMLEGTLAYISPEQTGRMNRVVDYRTDFYSLGATFYELLTGQVPFPTGDILELLHCHLAKQPIAPHEINPDIPRAVSDIVVKLLAKDAIDRYQSARGVIADLEECLRQWQTTRHIEPFLLGKQDSSDRFQFSQKLYGREREIELLLSAFERTCAGNTEMMLVYGYAGIGKTALVQEIYKPVSLRHGYFLTGKFDQYQRNTPYSAFIQAFRSLIRQLLTESETAIADWSEQLQVALGPNGGVILEVIPEVELIIGPQPAVPPLGPSESQNRFHLVFQDFIRVFTRPEHPLVIFLDDLQWADGASLNLIKMMLTAPDTQYLFFIGTYRDNEVSASHPFILTLEELRRVGIAVNAIALGPLHLTHLTCLIADTLRCTFDYADPLAELMHARTGGNPFFLMEFLKNLYDKGLLVFDCQCGVWQWELSQIEAQGVTDNVVDLIAGKVQRLQPETQEVLKLAACIGNVFNLKILADVYEKTPSETASDLWPAFADGMVLPLRKVFKYVTTEMDALTDDNIIEYKFVHDRIHQALYSLISREEAKALHVKVGQILLRNTSPAEREVRIFDIVNQLNEGRELIYNHALRDELAKFNLLAGRKAKSSAAFDPAFSYLKVGIELLRKDGWETQYDLSLALYVEAAEAAYLSGNFESMEGLSEAVLNNAKTLIDQVKAYEVKIQAAIAQNRQREAVQIALPVLKLLGVKIPVKPNKLHLLTGFLKTKTVLAGKRIEDLVDLPAMTDPHKLAAMRILTRIGSAAYIAAPDLMPFFIFEGVNLSIKHGAAPESAFGYVAYGMILCGKIVDVESGYQFGRLASRLLERFDDKALAARTLFAFNAFIRHWKESLHETIDPLREGYQSGLYTGDLEFAGRCINAFCNRSFFVGRELGEVDRCMTLYRGAVYKIKQKSPLLFFEPFHQIVLNLRGRSETPRQIISDLVDEKRTLSLDHEDNRVLAFFLYLSKLMLHYLFEEIPQAVENADMAEKYLEGAFASAPKSLFYLYSSLSRLAIYDSSPQAEKKRILKKVASNQKKLGKWARYAPMNYLHKFYLVEAERARVSENYDEADKYYNKAISLAQDNDYPNEEALAYELAGKFHVAQKQATLARVYLHDAHYAYLRWGATAKVQDLEARFPQLFEKTMAVPAVLPSTSLLTSTTRQQDISALDLTSVIKASQAISSEIVLNQLVSTLMSILIENAGAQRGFLILEKKGQLLIEEEGAVSIINYVARTHETVVLPDATHDTPFSRDPYILSRQPKSIICMPLLHQGQLTGILYLENNLTTNAFTPERLEILRLLSGQIAISLTNALLYDELEMRVQKRTAELSETNILLKQEIEERQKTGIKLIQAKEDAEAAYRVAEAANRAKSIFLANMSHEIRTPLNAMIGFTNLAMETQLSDKQRDYLHKIYVSSQNLLGIINDILDFSKIEAGKLDLDYREFKLESVIDHLSSMFSDKAAEKGITLSISTNEDVPFSLIGDSLRLEQILINLVNNAIKFTDSGEVAISVYLEKMESKTVRLLFAVRDTGIGIPQDSLKKIFNTFTQLDGSVTRNFGGTGLGLSICKRLVELMGGKIWVESVHGSGSTFYFTADFTRLLDEEQYKKTDIAHTEVNENLIGARILLVEDNIINQQVAKEILEGADFVVDVANNGREAVERVRRDDYDAVLMDIQMPEMSGYEATCLIRSDVNCTKLPIIAMTAHAMHGAGEDYRSAGMTDFVLKPINKGDLFSVLNQWIKPRLSVKHDEPAATGNEPPNQANDPELPDTLPGINIPSGLERLYGDRKLYAKLLKMFSRDYAGVMGEIKAALGRKDIETAARLTHTIRGVAGNLSAQKLQQSAGALENGIKQQNPGNIDNLLESFEHCLTQVLESVKYLEQRSDEATEQIGQNHGNDTQWAYIHPSALRDAIVQLEDESIPLCERTKQRGIFNEINSFGHHVKAQGEKYGIKPLEKFGDDLIGHVSSYDIENINLLLNSFPELVGKIKSLK